MKIEIKVIGNQGLYRDLQAAFAAESTSHRTYTGAARRLVALNSKSKDWARTTGKWGRWDILIEGVSLYKSTGEFDYWAERSVEDCRETYKDPVSAIASDLRDRHAEIQNA